MPLLLSLSLFLSQHLELEPPEDQSIVTLWLGNVDSDINEEDIRGVIYPFGFIVSISIVRSGRCAFVEYADRGTAEYAAGQMYNALLIKGYPISVSRSSSLCLSCCLCSYVCIQLYVSKL
jgi:hypothetical protein